MSSSFGKEIRELHKELQSDKYKQEDFDHLLKMKRWVDVCGLVGIAACAFGVNPVAIVGLAAFTFGRWAMIAHHSSHGAYPGGRFDRNRFALGSLPRRVMDWFDWMLPEAWNLEHNHLHHYRLGEDEDPDLVERNTGYIRSLPLPVPVKMAFIGLLALVWKWLYYAPNAYKEWQLGKHRGEKLPKGFKPTHPFFVYTFFTEECPSFLTLPGLVVEVLLPYFVGMFVLLPAAFSMAMGPAAGWATLTNLVLAELLTNVWGFIAIVPNHAGKDMYAFRTPCKPHSDEFYLRQIVGSVDYGCGSDVLDFMQGFLNYQIEHHLFPSLSMRGLQRAQPKVKAICAKYNIPYVQENAFVRVYRMMEVGSGKCSMKWVDSAMPLFLGASGAGQAS